MARRWDREDWRKLYSRVDAKWLSLPLLTRGLGSELLKYAERPSGTIAIHAGETAEDAVIRLLAAHRSEAAAVRKAVKQLIADGYLVVTEGAISIKNFEAAQARSSNAERQAAFRDRRLRHVVTSNATDNATFDEQSALRSDGSRDRAPAGACTLHSSSPTSGSGSPESRDPDPDTARGAGSSLGEAILAELERHRVFAPIASAEVAEALALAAFDRKRSPEDAAACVREAGLKGASRAAAAGPLTIDKLTDWVTSCIWSGPRSNGRSDPGARRPSPATDVQRGGYTPDDMLRDSDEHSRKLAEEDRLRAERNAERVREGLPPIEEPVF